MRLRHATTLERHYVNALPRLPWPLRHAITLKPFTLERYNVQLFGARLPCRRIHFRFSVFRFGFRPMLEVSYNEQIQQATQSDENKCDGKVVHLLENIGPERKRLHGSFGL